MNTLSPAEDENIQEVEGKAQAPQTAPPAGTFPQPPASPPLPTNGRMNFEMLVDVPVQITVELGRTQMTIKEVLDLERGSVVELDRVAGDPVDVLVNGSLIAVGEVVVVDDRFGVRISSLVNPAAQNGVK